MKERTFKLDSDRLERAGVNPESSDLYAIEDKFGQRSIILKENIDTSDILLFPVWTLGKLLELLPTELPEDPEVILTIQAKREVYYKKKYLHDWVRKEDKNQELLDNVVDMVCWWYSHKRIYGYDR